ncbi:MAG TPA: hypothetical protein VG756_19430 [Pseudonocardiaceae bacterium]|jgi:hypothetical protein|nr:hypothetical protein [Pseudonocardiaceae bacterium]
MAEYVLEMVGYFSETELVLKILAFFGFNVEDWVKERLFGDYKALAKCRNAILNLADFENTAATAIAEGTATMLKSWQGTAASAAQGYFDQLANAIAAHGESLSSLAGKLDTLVIAIQQIGATLIGAITQLLDWVVQALAKAAAAGCLQEVPGVDVVLDAMSASQVVKIVKKVKEIGDIWGKWWTVYQGMVGGIMTLIGGLQTYSASIKPPAVGYANASQGQQPEEDSSTPTGRRGPQ